MSREPQTPDAPPSSRRRRDRGQTRPPWLKPALVLLAALFGLLILDALYVGVKLRTSLRSAASHLEDARARFDAENLSPTREALDEALISAAEAHGLTGHPSYVVASHLPLVGTDASVIRELSEAARRAARAGLSGIRALEEATGSEGESLAAALYRDGVVDFRAAERAFPFVREADRLLGLASDSLLRLPDPRFDVVSSALERARVEIVGASESAHKGVALLDALPSLMGNDGIREYLLIFQSPSEARGFGGFPGIYGILTAEEGRLELGRLRPISDLGRADRPVAAPGWYSDLYRDSGALVDPRQAGFSPEFPTVAGVLLDQYESQTDQRLDGVFAMDPHAFGELTRGTGPVSAPGLDREVGPSNAVKTLLYDSYVLFEDTDAQDRYLAGLVKELWSRLGSGEVDAEGLAAGLSSAAQSQHLKVFSIIPDIQDSIVALGAEGSYADEGPHVQMVFNNNAAANKIDYFLERHVDTEVVLRADGSADVSTSIVMENAVPPDAPTSLVFGPGIKGDQVGDNGMTLYALMPQGSQLRSFTVGGSRGSPLQGRESDYPVAYELVVVAAGETVEAVVNYRTSGAWDDGSFRFALHPQATVNADTYDLTVVAPPGAAVRSSEDIGVSARPTISFSGTLDRPVRVSLDVVER